jgi:CheY-like chemotaxis protein
MNRVLIVEDDPTARRQLAQLFRYEQFEVAEADTGDAGIAAAARQTPDLVVCDIMMPGTDGFGVLEALRKRGETALTPFIFLTAKAGSQDVRQGMGHGADDYITKPFDPEALLASARQRLARRKAQIEEAERRAADTGISAAAALPREMEGCLAHLERISEGFAAAFHGGVPAGEMQASMKQELARLRSLSQRLRLYAELPGLYARRFSESATAAGGCSHTFAEETAAAAARPWARSGDLLVTGNGAVPLPAPAVEVLVRELVDNACKFSKPSTPVTLALEREPACWSMIMTDCGRGMSPQQIAQIGAFKQFWSGPERPAGLGLGLVLVQTLARLHSGEVAIESAPGKGTCVRVMFPAEQS